VTFPSIYRVLCATLLLACQPAFAHEAWLEPFDYHLEKSSLVRGHIRAGQFFRGNTQLYNPDKFKRFEVMHNGKARKVKGRTGDLPAIKHKLKQPGLHTLVYQSSGEVIRYPTWEKFQNFSEKEGVSWAQQAHLDRGLPKENFSEIFVRYAKSLIDWKTSEGRDSNSGMPFEIIALSNPYEEGTSTIEVQVLWQNTPYSAGQLTIFSKAKDIETARSTVALDSEGKARLSVNSGFSYLLNCVLIEPIDGKKNTPVWRSHWASITFEMPD